MFASRHDIKVLFSRMLKMFTKDEHLLVDKSKVNLCANYFMRNTFD